MGTDVWHGNWSVIKFYALSKLEREKVNRLRNRSNLVSLQHNSKS